MKNNYLKSLRGLFSIICSGFLLVTSCNTNVNSTDNNDSIQDSVSDMAAMDSSSDKMPDLKPTGPKPDWAPTITSHMQVVMEKLASYGDAPIVKLSAPEARKTHSPADAVMDLIKENNISVPASMVDTTGKNIPVQGGNIHLRIYTPKSGSGPFPVIVYYHGGGWVIANLDTYNSSAQSLAEQTGSVLVSVAYRQAPEYKFPTAHNDSFAAYQWVLANAASIKGDPKNVAVVGESAGGNLAAAVSLMARDKNVALPVHQVLVYPIAGSDVNTESYAKYADAKPLNKPLMQWFFSKYPGQQASTNKMIDLVNADLKGLPPTTIINAEIDPLQTEGATLASKFKSAGVKVNHRLYKGVTHEFFGMAAIISEAREAQAFAASELKAAFGK